MSFLNNLRMVYKVGLIALVMAGVMIGLISYMASEMSAIDEAYSDVVKRVDTSTTTMARTTRRAETYRGAAFAVLTETTDEGNAKRLKTTRDASAQVLESLAKVKADLPEKAAQLGEQIEHFKHV